jgi:hypothetical protein
MKEVPLTVKLLDINGSIQTIGRSFIEVKKEGQGAGAFFVILPMNDIHQRKTMIKLGFYQGDKKISECKTSFLGPIAEKQ